MWKVLEDSFYLNTFYTNLTKKMCSCRGGSFSPSLEAQPQYQFSKFKL